MKLKELVRSFSQLGTAKDVVREKMPNAEFDSVVVFLKSRLHHNSETLLVDSEIVSADRIIQVNGIQYVRLFEAYILQDMVEQYSGLTYPVLSSLEVARKVVLYKRRHNRKR